MKLLDNCDKKLYIYIYRKIRYIKYRKELYVPFNALIYQFNFSTRKLLRPVFKIKIILASMIFSFFTIVTPKIIIQAQCQSNYLLNTKVRLNDI